MGKREVPRVKTAPCHVVAYASACAEMAAEAEAEEVAEEVAVEAVPGGRRLAGRGDGGGARESRSEHADAREIAARSDATASKFGPFTERSFAEPSKLATELLHVAMAGELLHCR